MLCTFAPARDGYCQVGANGKHPMAHRVVYEHFVGPIPEGMTLDHQCNRRNCVNYHHLVPATIGANNLRGDGPAARNARKTHCDHGHEFTPENTYIYRGNRYCRACATERDHRRLGWQGNPHNRDKTHCKRKHPLSGDNLRIDKKGGRVCITCERWRQRESARRRYHEKKRAALEGRIGEWT